MLTLDEFRQAQKENPNVKVQDLLAKKRADKNLTGQQQKNVAAIVAKVAHDNRSISERYPRLAALISQKPKSSIVDLVKKVMGPGPKYRTSVDAEAARIRQMCEVPKAGHQETSVDKLRKKLNQ